jgi:hypothetical protein
VPARDLSRAPDTFLPPWKKQQMRWTPRGAHLLLQIRVQAINDDLHTAFQRWYPDLKPSRQDKLAA